MTTHLSPRHSHPPRPAAPPRPVVQYPNPQPDLDEPLDVIAPLPPPDLATMARHFDFAIPEAVIPYLDATSPQEAILKLVGSLVETGVIPDAVKHAVVARVLEREATASTAIGDGIAIPHGRHDALPRLVAAIGYCRHGVDFAALDGQPVKLIFLVVSPTGANHEHLCALKAISDYLLQQRQAA